MIKVLPFKCVNAFTDIKNKIIYVSSNIKNEDIYDVMCDEFGHILSKSNKHDEKWENACKNFYGFVPSYNNIFDEDKILCDTDFGMNVGNITGIQNLLTDYHLLQSYRKFSQKVLGTDGSWEITGNNKIRLKPTPKGSFPVVVRYLPSVDDFQQPAHKEVCVRFLLAECKIMLGHIRRKMTIPSPDGGTMQMDGDALVSEGIKERDEAIQYALDLGEPMGFIIK
jgi:hypothetical protein